MGEEIAVDVELKSLLSRFATKEKGTRFSEKLQAGDSVARLLERLDLPTKWIGLVAVNGRKVARDHLLNDGDRVQIYPPFLSGG